MFKALCLLSLLSCTLSLRVQHEINAIGAEAEKCGVVLGGFGSAVYTEKGAETAAAIRRLNATKGWCPQDPELDYVPVTFFSDNSELKCPEGVNCMLDTAFGEVPEAIETNTVQHVRKRLGSWKLRWYHSEMMVHSPYGMGVYVDLDAVPCSGDKLGDLLKQMTDKKAAVGSIIHGVYPCLQTGNNCAKPHPAGANVHEWSRFKERNAGAIVFDKSVALPMFEDYSKYIAESATMKRIQGDQYAFRAALFMNKEKVPEIIFNDGDICRYGNKHSCEAGCAIVHKKGR